MPAPALSSHQRLRQTRSQVAEARRLAAEQAAKEANARRSTDDDDDDDETEAPKKRQKRAPFTGALRHPPCLQCVRAFISGKSALECHEPSSERAKRCQRCSAGHACTPLPSVFLPWIKWHASSTAPAHLANCRKALRALDDMFKEGGFLSAAEAAPAPPSNAPRAALVPSSRAEAHQMIADLHRWLAEAPSEQ